MISGMGGSELDGRSAELVGRGPECAAIDRLLENASQSRSGSVVVRGEAGMGKTALLGYAADRAGEMRVLRVTGVEAESDLAFAGLHGLVWPIVEELRHLHEPQRGALGAALGLARGEGQDRFLVSAGVLSLLAAAAEATPIVCLVDDAQWLDVPSADALVFTARRLVAEGVVMLFGAREGEPRRFEGPGLEQLIVGGLDRTSACAGEAADGLPYASRAVGIARERGLMTALAFALQMQADRLIGDSRFDLAYATAEEGWRLALDIGQPWAASWNLANVATVDALRGDEQSARAHAAELHALVATSGATLVIAHLERALGLLDLGRGRPGEALDRLLVAIAAARYESHPLFVLALPDAVEAAVRADRLREVAEHLDSFQSWVQRFPNRARLALLARCRALIEESDAERHFVQAIELADVLSPFDRARTELLYGEWLRRQRRRVDARRHLRAALEQFQQLAVAPWEARARSELRASGETARKRDPSTSDQLTPQELQIARLVADGKTNPGVAAELFLSPRTIDYHLRKVFAKLEIASRADLAGMNLGEPAIA
jgi:DNA-binding CsgD family transcriptional regulator